MLFEVLYRRGHPMFPDALCVELLDIPSLEDVVYLFQRPGNEGVELLEVQAIEGEL